MEVAGLGPLKGNKTTFRKINIQKITRPKFSGGTLSTSWTIAWDVSGSNLSAIVKNLNQVAMEMGNSPNMVIQSYREVFSEAQAEKFWDLNPAQAKAISNKFSMV